MQTLDGMLQDAGVKLKRRDKAEVRNKNATHFLQSAAGD